MISPERVSCTRANLSSAWTAANEHAKTHSDPQCVSLSSKPTTSGRYWYHITVQWLKELRSDESTCLVWVEVISVKCVWTLQRLDSHRLLQNIYSMENVHNNKHRLKSVFLSFTYCIYSTISECVRKPRFISQAAHITGPPYWSRALYMWIKTFKAVNLLYIWASSDVC